MSFPLVQKSVTLNDLDPA